MHPRQNEVAPEQSFLHLYSDGFGLGNRNWRLSNIVPNLKSYAKTTTALAGTAMSLFGNAQALSCGRNSQIVTANAYFKDANGTNYEISREGCNTPTGEGSFSITDLANRCAANITFPSTDIASNYVELSNYYYDTMQLNAGAGEITNSTMVTCAKAYLSELEASFFAYDQKVADENSVFLGALFGSLGGIFAIGITLACCFTVCKPNCQCNTCCQRKPTINNDQVNIEANLPQVQIQELVVQKPATEKSEAEKQESNHSGASSPRLFVPALSKENPLSSGHHDEGKKLEGRLSNS